MPPASWTRIWGAAASCSRWHLLNESEEACPGPTLGHQPNSLLVQADVPAEGPAASVVWM